MKEGDPIKFRNGGEGIVVRYPSGDLGINILPYKIMCEPISNYNGLKHKFLEGLDIIPTPGKDK